MSESTHSGEPAPSTGGANRWGRRGVKGLVTSTDAVLLLREDHANGREFWTLPGGGVRPGEPSRAALRRELHEELQCDAVIGEPVAGFAYAHVSPPRRASFYTVYDSAVTEQPTANAAEGITACRWVCPRDPPARTLPQVRALLRTTVAGTTA